MKLAHRRLVALNKKQLLIVGAAIFLVCLAGYILWSSQVWGNYQAHYIQWQQEVGSDVKKAAMLSTGTSTERAKVVAVFDNVARRIATTSHGVCEVNPLVQWQEAMLSGVKTKRSICQTMVKKVVDFQLPLAETTAYIKADTLLADVFAAMPQTDELSVADFEKQLTAWSAASTATSKLTGPDSFKPVQQLAVKQVAAVKGAWQEVIAANQAKDKKRYLAAQDSLAAALDNLDEVSRTSQTSFLSLAAKLKTATVVAFDS